MSKFRFLFIQVLICFISITVLTQQNAGPRSTAAANLTAEQWREDLRHMKLELERVHKNLFHAMRREEFDKALNKLDKRIPDLAEHEIVVEMMRIVAMIGDGHTGLRADQLLSGSGIYPIRFYLFEDGLFIQQAATEFKDIVGGKVIRIGNTPAARVLDTVRQIVWRDNEMGVRQIAPLLISSPQVLHALKLSGSLEKVSLTVSKDGKERTVVVRPTGRLQQLITPPGEWEDARKSSAQTPLWLKSPQQSFWFEYLEEREILYVQYNAVRDKQDETVEAFFNRVFAWAEKNPVEKLVLDIRLNGGGNNYLNLPLTIGAIKSKLNRRGKFFVIIGRQTFSAAQNAVNELEKYTNAIFVGEPTGASPNHFGDARPISLPNSKLIVRASTLWWQDSDPRDTRQWTAPDIAAELTSADYIAGRDPALAAIINYKSGSTFDDLVAGASSNQDISVFIRKYRTFKDDPKNKFIDTESGMNRFGYRLMREKRLDDAIEIFKLNVEGYPESPNVFDSLAEAYLAKGNRELAITNYKKALRIDPNFPSAKNALNRLGHKN